MNPAALFKLKGYWSRFTQNHPKLIPYGSAVYQNALREGSVVDIKVTPPGGAPLCYNMRLNAEDLALLAELKNALGK